MHSTALPSPALRHQEAFYGKDIVLADRNVVESEADSIYASAKDEDVSFLVVGDPLCATTHTDLIIRARELGVKVRLKIVVLGSSIASCFFFFLIVLFQSPRCLWAAFLSSGLLPSAVSKPRQL